MWREKTSQSPLGSGAGRNILRWEEKNTDTYGAAPEWMDTSYTYTMGTDSRNGRRFRGRATCQVGQGQPEYGTHRDLIAGYLPP